MTISPSSAIGTRDEKFSFFNYDPSIPAAIVFIVLFFSTTAYHCWQAFTKRTFYFIPLIIGGVFEWTGYIVRILAHFHIHSMVIYVAQTLLLFLPPSLFAASDYMVLGCLILYTKGESVAPIRANWLTKIFVTGDVFTFIVQAVGNGSMLAKSSTRNLGKKVVIVGLALQIIFFGIFIITSAISHRRIASTPTSASLQAPWQKYLWTLYVASSLILIRSIFRIFEFAEGDNGKLVSNEVFLYAFDAA
ncbi:RTA1 like protein-domain-containing protein [Rhexocercosporidium sp. MPI-PUGE-AT-0058]|nr:RTA1 like protein-domain-containing protein [Rhexocercosporidium sp. MPI-PUGE-AT-0058]